HNLPQNFGISSVAAFPQPVTQNEFLIFSGLSFFCKKIAAKVRLHAQRREKVWSEKEILNFLRSAVAGKVYAVIGIGPEPVKGTRLLLPFEIGGGSDGSRPDILTRFRIHYRYELFDLLQRNGMQ